MITIQSAMLVALGFLAAALIALVVAPAYRRRAARLATDALKRAIPLTEAEIRADKDRLRAEYAIAIHRLEMKVSEGELAAARQQIELNRRDAAISDLEGRVTQLSATLDEQENARRVLEQTLVDRLPKVEGRLSEAKKMLLQRDREITTLSQSTGKQSAALEETTQINTQLREEIGRLNAALATRAARNRESVGDARFDGEVALRSEIEALRAKNRDQASHIVRLQGLVSRRDGTPLSEEELQRTLSRSAALGAVAAADGGETEKLRAALAEAEAALRAARGGDPAAAGGGDTGREALEQELRALKVASEERLIEVARLKAALASYQSQDEGEAGQDSRLALKAQLSALKVQSEEQATIVQRLRAEIAAANERLARQSQHFQDEMRRLGAGTMPVAASADAKRAPSEPARPSLSARIAAPRAPAPAPGAMPAAPVAVAAVPPPAAAVPPVSPAAVTGAPAGAGAQFSVVANVEPAQPVAVAFPSMSDAKGASVNGTAGNGVANLGVASGATPQAMPAAAPSSSVPGAAAARPEPATPKPEAGKPAEAPRRPRLMERIAGADKP